MDVIKLIKSVSERPDLDIARLKAAGDCHITLNLLHDFVLFEHDLDAHGSHVHKEETRAPPEKLLCPGSKERVHRK